MGNSGYLSEQVLSTTLFRIYRALGGDSPSADERRLAARYTASLLIRGTGLLDPLTPPASADDFEAALMQADIGAAQIAGGPGGAAFKIIRWGFEKQGLHRAPGTSSTSEGAPPEVDVYVDDGRQGEYLPYLSTFWNSPGVWNRQSADGQLQHQDPVPDADNFLYVAVKNRGTQTAENVRARAFLIRPGFTGQLWPAHWLSFPQNVTPGAGDPPRAIPAGGSAVLGPIRWRPEEGPAGVLIAVSADDDLSLLDPASQLAVATGPVLNARLVPLDNNLAQRMFSGGPGVLAQAETSPEGAELIVENPLDRGVQIALEATLPDVMARKGWTTQVGSALVEGLERGSIALPLEAGAPLSPTELDQLGDDPTLVVRLTVDGQPAGGVNLALAPLLQARSAAAMDADEAPESPPLFILLRHAEKSSDGVDPGLTEEGQARAERLADLLVEAGVDAIYASEARRTIETATPLAERLSLPIQTESQQDPTALIGTLYDRHPAGRVVVVGHSNTVPAMAAALGVAGSVSIGESVFDNLFLIVPATQGEGASLLLLKY